MRAAATVKPPDTGRQRTTNERAYRARQGAQRGRLTAPLPRLPDRPTGHATAAGWLRDRRAGDGGLRLVKDTLCLDERHRQPHSPDFAGKVQAQPA